jgi:hypothetical protein
MRWLLILLLVLGLALVAPACGGDGEKEEGVGPAESPAAGEEALRDAATTYHAAIARLELETAYAVEPAEFREACPFDEYEDLIAPEWADWVEECRFDDTSKVDYIIEKVAAQGNWWVWGYWQDERGRQCGGYGQWGYRAEWDYRDGAWVPVDTLPCAYARENSRLLATLPELSGAEQMEIDRYIYTRGEGPPFRHAILVTYDAPRAMSAQEVIDLYIESLAPEWQYTIATYGGSSLFLDLTRGTAAIQIDPGNMSAPRHTFNVHIDSRGAEPQ